MTCPGHIRRRQCRAGGVLKAVIGGSQTAGYAGGGEVVIAELCTVAHHQLWLGQSAQMIDQLLQTNSTVIAKAGQLAILTAEQGVVDLLPPRTRRCAGR